MKYYKKDGQEYIENGKSKVRVGQHALKPSQFFPKERTVKVFEVLEVLRMNPGNPVQPGYFLALSFPNDRLNAKEYEWYKRDPDQFEECQIPMVIKDEALARIGQKIVERKIQRN